MKKLLFLSLLALASFISLDTVAQKFYVRDIFDLYNDIGAPGSSEEQGQKTYDDIEGTPYFQKQFIDGSIITNKGSKYEKIPLRYNVYDDRIEFKHKSGLVFFLTKPEDYKRILINSQTYIYGSFKIGKKSVSGYYELLADGKISILKKQHISLRESAPAKPFSDPKPAKFVSKPDQFYLLVDKTKIHELKNEKSILSVLSEKKEELATFIKSNKLKAKKEDDLKKIISYYNTL